VGAPPADLGDHAFWVEAYNKALLCLRPLVGQPVRTYELIGDAVALAYPGGDKAWDPAKYPSLSVYLFELAKGLLSHQRRNDRLRKKHEEPYAPEIAERVIDPIPDPRALLLEKERILAGTRVFAIVRSALADDPQALAVLELIEADVLKLAEQVTELGWTESEVRNARKRIARAYDKLRYASRDEEP
jgi:hypothetical protein